MIALANLKREKIIRLWDEKPLTSSQYLLLEGDESSYSNKTNALQKLAKCHHGSYIKRSPPDFSSRKMPIELKIKTLDSRVLTFQVEGNETILDIKNLVFNETQVPVEQQRLIFRGKVLKDNLALSTYPGLLDGGSTVHMVPKQNAPPPDPRASGASGAQQQHQQPQQDPNLGFGQIPQMQVC